MKNLILVILCFTGIAACAQNKYNLTLKRQLDSVMVLDQKYRDTLTLLMTPDKAGAITKSLGMTTQVATGHYWKLQKTIDSANTIFVEGIFSKYGYPGKTLVGDGSNEAAWYVIQHSDKIDSYLPLIKEAAEAHELPFKLYAMMLDRYLMNKNQEQVYGTQATMRKLKASGKSEWFIWPIKNPETVNQRRKDAGFPDTVEDNAKRLGVQYRVVKLNDLNL